MTNNLRLMKIGIVDDIDHTKIRLMIIRNVVQLQEKNVIQMMKEMESVTMES